MPHHGPTTNTHSCGGTMRTRTITAAALATLALTLPGCSAGDSSDDSAAPTSEATTEPNGSTEVTPKDEATDDKNALEKSVREYTRALFTPDPKAGYALVSERCKAAMSADDFARLSKQGHHEHGALTIKTIHVDQLSGDLARVSYGVGVPQFERKAQPWTREGGTWKWDACPSTG